MAAPTFVAASTGNTDATGAWSATCHAPGAADRIIIFQMLVDGVTAGAPTISSTTNIKDLADTSGAWTTIGTFDVGSAVAGTQQLYIGRSASTSAPVITGANTGGDDLYWRFYEFQNCATGTTLASVIENACLGLIFGGSTNRQVFGAVGTFEMQAQSFASPGAFTLTSVSLVIDKTSTPTDNLVIEIQTDSAGEPSGSVVGTVATAAGSSFTTTPTTYTYSCSIALSASTTYWIVCRRDGARDTTNTYILEANLASTYAGGVNKARASGVWGAAASDLDFRLTFSGDLGASNSAATGTVISDTGVTTLGVDRLACNFGAITDDLSGIAVFTGMTGGTWADFQSFETATGTDGTVFFEDAAMATAGTIAGGSATIVSLPWGVVGFALIGTTVAAGAVSDPTSWINERRTPRRRSLQRI